MIFVTVGTHEQPFNRLIKAVDELKEKKQINEEVFIQIGYSTYIPKFCKWSKVISYDEMDYYIKNARIVITHGGPASFLAPIREQKIPIVVPRQKQFKEHVNDHQVEFVREVESRMKNIIPIYDLGQLEYVIQRYEDICAALSVNMKNNNLVFNHDLEEMVKHLFTPK